MLNMQNRFYFKSIRKDRFNQFSIHNLDEREILTVNKRKTKLARDVYLGNVLPAIHPKDIPDNFHLDN